MAKVQINCWESASRTHTWKSLRVTWSDLWSDVDFLF